MSVVDGRKVGVGGGGSLGDQTLNGGALCGCRFAVSSSLNKVTTRTGAVYALFRLQSNRL